MPSELPSLGTLGPGGGGLGESQFLGRNWPPQSLTPGVAWGDPGNLLTRLVVELNHPGHVWKHLLWVLLGKGRLVCFLSSLVLTDETMLS